MGRRDGNVQLLPVSVHRTYSDDIKSCHDPGTCSPPADDKSSLPNFPAWAAPCCYGALNMISSVSIVVANKLVLQTYGFSFPTTLTLLHTVFTAAGMTAMAYMGMFTPKPMRLVETIPVSAAFVASVVLGNLSLQMNNVGFYQLSKLLVPPVVMAIDYLLYRKTITLKVALSVVVVISGGCLAGVSDDRVTAQPLAAVVALDSVAATALYQVWAGRKQKELELDAMQLLHRVSVVSAGLLAVLLPLVEPVGWSDPAPGTLLGYTPFLGAVLAILYSCTMALLVTLSMFLFIGSTSPLTFNVMGQAKMLLIIAAGVVVFHEQIGGLKLVGIVMALSGVGWYTWLSTQGQ